MNVNMSLIPEFEELWSGFTSDKSGIEYLKIEGIAPDDLDIGIKSREFSVKACEHIIRCKLKLCREH